MYSKRYREPEGYKGFDCERFGVGVISPNAFSEHSFGQLGDEQFPRLLRPLMANFSEIVFERH